MYKPWNPEGLTQDPMLGNSFVLILFQDSQTVCTEDGKFCTNVGPGGDRRMSNHHKKEGMMEYLQQPPLLEPLLRQFGWLFPQLYYIQEPVNYSGANNCNGKAFISHQSLSNLKSKDDNWKQRRGCNSASQAPITIKSAHPHPQSQSKYCFEAPPPQSWGQGSWSHMNNIHWSSAKTPKIKSI